MHEFTVTSPHADAPGPVRDMKLDSDKHRKPILQWSHPKGNHPNINTTYIVNITNTETAITILVRKHCTCMITPHVPNLSNIFQSIETNDTYVHVPVDQSREVMCQLHTFSVHARNDAGSSPVSTLRESIPLCEADTHMYTHTLLSISLHMYVAVNIAPVSHSQRIVGVQLTGSNAYINVSFEVLPNAGVLHPCTPCDLYFPNSQPGSAAPGFQCSHTVCL